MIQNIKNIFSLVDYLEYSSTIFNDLHCNISHWNRKQWVKKTGRKIT